jgi:hypothetical protein
MSCLYQDTRRGKLNEHEALALLDRITEMRIGLLGG